jgi:hypothetical protein
MIISEKRKIQRLRTLKAGKITLNQGGIIDCVVRNITIHGACLEVPSTIGIPDEFTFMNSDQIQQPCRLIWRSQKKIGVAFKLVLWILPCLNSPLVAQFEIGEWAVMIAA